MRRLLLAGVALLAVAASAQAATPLPPISEQIAHDLGLRAAEAAALPGARVRPVWLEGGRRFLYWVAGDSPRVIVVDTASGRTRAVLEGRAMTAALAALKARGESGPLTLHGLGADGRTLSIRAGGEVLEIDAGTGATRPSPALTLQDRLSRPRVISDQKPTTFGDLMEIASPDGARLVTVQGDDLYVRSGVDDRLTRITRDGTPRSSWRSTEESAQAFPVAWAPDSRRFAAVKLDTTITAYEPLPHWLRARPEIEPVAYPRSGEPMYAFQLAIFDAVTGVRTAIDTGDTHDRYVNLLGWRGDGSAVFYRVIDREQKHLRIYAADARTGVSTLLLSEDSATYIDMPMTLGLEVFYPLRRSNGFVYLSERDGVRQAYLHDAAGRQVRRLTDGQLPVEEVIGVDEAGGRLYYMAAADAARPYDRNLFRAPLAGGPAQRLTPEPGNHRVVMAPDFSGFVDRASSVDQAPKVSFRAADGHALAALETVDPAALMRAGFGGVERVQLPSKDGRWMLEGVVARPYGFDPSRRYPVIEYIYGGMQSTTAPRDFYTYASNLAGPEVRSFLGADYVVVILDSPGTPGRGRAFQDATYETWPQRVIPEHEAWIRKAAASRPWMDLGRVGVYGHSWGSYMAQRALIDAPDFYRVAVGHAGPSDFYDHPTYIEPFMGLPWNNPDGYAAASNLTGVDRIKGRILLMGAPLDVNAGFSPTFKFIDAMVKAKKDVDLFVLPDSNHRLNCCGPDAEAYMTAVVTRYFKAHLDPIMP